MASRLRSRQVICTTGSTPASLAKAAAAIDDMRTTAVWLSVMLTASTTPLSSFALLRITSGSAPLGGPSSPVTANAPEEKTRLKFVSGPARVSSDMSATPE